MRAFALVVTIGVFLRAAGAMAADTPGIILLVPTSEKVGQTWKYTTEKPASGWHRPDFDDSGWKSGKGMFGTAVTQNIRLGTEWNTSDIYLRRTFTLKNIPEEFGFRIYHDDAAEVYLNGSHVTKYGAYTNAFVDRYVGKGVGVLKQGSNAIAVHCHQTIGGQAIDVGIVKIRREKLYHESLRPQFHFTARYWKDYRLNPGPHQEGWINDVNGLVYLDGTYHLFGQRWWSCWLHAVSKDLVHWTEVKPAFGDHTQSGSCVVDIDNVSGLGDGKTPPMVALWSGTDNLSQCISYSLDRGGTWKKYHKNPVLKHPERDPNVFWYEPDKRWIMVLYGPPERSYVFFSSKNLLDWKKHENCEVSNMFECPDMFSLPVDGDWKNTKWVLVDGNGEYLIGSFDGKRFHPETEQHRGDYGDFYATQTWSDMRSKRRRIQLAWMRGGRYPGMPFNQQWTFPCTLSLRTLPQGIRLCRNPVKEIELLYDKKHEIAEMDLRAGNKLLTDIQGESFDIELEIDMARSDFEKLEFNLRGNVVTYEGGLIQFDGSRMKVTPRSGISHLRILLDRTSIEVFGNHGEKSMSKCVLPGKSESPLAMYTRLGGARIKYVKTRTLKTMWEGMGKLEE